MHVSPEPRSTNQVVALPVLAGLALGASGCELVEGVFKLGMWSAVILVAIAAFVIFAVVRMLRG